MPKYLTQEWLDTQREIAQEFPERPGATAHLQYIVTGGPEGEVRYYWVVENGKILEDELGEDPDAEVTMTITWEDSAKMQRGELDETAAFMQGRLKVQGNMGKLMSLMPLTQSPEYKAIKAKITEVTEF
ncbi:MAG TPA: SCP2 sterol-binding domain-containing protein [Acidimicrobiales bacterium]|nr:SCP2 sterol-binding domain-containing protein [Acidimicrobiales bacterium]